MKVRENYIAPPLRAEDVVVDEVWLRENFERFLEFMYSEHPSWRFMKDTTPENYGRVAQSKGLPVYRVGIAPGEKMRLKKVESVRIVFVEEGGVVVPMFIVDGDGFIVV